MSRDNEEVGSKPSFYFQLFFENVSAPLHFFEAASWPMMSRKPHSQIHEH
jgi:hypothetical protein